MTLVASGRVPPATLLPLALCAACGGKDDVSPNEPGTLEAARVALPDDEELDGLQRDYVGTLEVSGGGADWTVTVGAVGGTDIEVHSPAQSDLSVLEGLVDARASVAVEPLSGELSLAVVDADGELAYLVEPVEPGALTESLLGAGFVAAGNDLGAVAAGAWDLALTSALVRTDAGDAELLPGEPQELVIDGVTYRAVLLDSFDATLKLDGDVECTGAADRLAFELLRVDAGSTDLNPLVRAEGVELPTSSCSGGT